MQNEKIKKTIKYCVVIIIITVTFALFGFYIIGHPELISALKNLDFTTLLLLTIGYVIFTLINAAILYYSLRFINKKIPISDNIILTGYSSIVNFFGPLQSGPGFRAIYLKKIYDVRLRDFLVTTLIFYGFFGLINVTIIATASACRFGSVLFYAYSLLVLLLLSIMLYFIATRVRRVRIGLQNMKFKNKNFWLIGLGAIGLTIIMIAIYFIEVNHVNPSISITQTIIYTAAANLSLFVSITPAAIGIRESFLALSQQLHGVDTTTIIGASIIDRAFYVGFLVLLFSTLLIINSRKHLSIFKLKPRK